jgi:hypothetical protein
MPARSSVAAQADRPGFRSETDRPHGDLAQPGRLHPPTARDRASETPAARSCAVSKVTAMPRTPLSISRRSLFALLGLQPALTGSRAYAADDPIFAIAHRRQVLMALVDGIRDEDELDRLCPGLDAIAAEMAVLPTLSFSAALLKLRIVGESYCEGHTTAGFDLRLFHQVLDWMTVEVARRP